MAHRIFLMQLFSLFHFSNTEAGAKKKCGYNLSQLYSFSYTYLCKYVDILILPHFSHFWLQYCIPT